MGNEKKNNIVSEFVLKSYYQYHDVSRFKVVLAKTVGVRIKNLRDQNKISGADLAKVIGISQQQMSRYENGLSDISFYKLILISIYFNVDFMFFLKNE